MFNQLLLRVRSSRPNPAAPPGFLTALADNTKQATTLPQAFTVRTLHDPTTGAWNMDTCASSYLNNSVTSLTTIFNSCMYPSVSIGDGHLIPVTNSGHSIFPTTSRSCHQNNDFLTHRVLLRCDSTGDLYPVTAPSSIMHAFLGTDTTYLLLYVDDIALTAFSETLLQQVIGWLHQKFSMTDLGSLNYFLGIFVTLDSLGMSLSQKKYDVEILERADIVNCNSSRTPVDTKSKLVQQVCLHMHDPREPHLSALKPILRYVRGTLDYGLQLFSSSTTDLVAYTDADWAGCPITRRSTSGYCVFLGNNLLSWSSKRQPMLSRSNAEAEYRGTTTTLIIIPNPTGLGEEEGRMVMIHFGACSFFEVATARENSSQERPPVYGISDADTTNRNGFLTKALSIREDPHATIHLQLSQPDQLEPIEGPRQSRPTNLGLQLH
nr:hypothetical protein [Tanacetum cinerariifolium]